MWKLQKCFVLISLILRDILMILLPNLPNSIYKEIYPCKNIVRFAKTILWAAYPTTSCLFVKTLLWVFLTWRKPLVQLNYQWLRYWCFLPPPKKTGVIKLRCARRSIFSSLYKYNNIAYIARLTVLLLFIRLSIC